MYDEEYSMKSTYWGIPITAIGNLLVSAILLHYLNDLYRRTDCRKIDPLSHKILYDATILFVIMNAIFILYSIFTKL